MKKIICIVLALMLTLTAVAALAVSSKTNEDLQEVKAEGATVTKAEEVEPAVEAVLEDLDAAQEKIAAGEADAPANIVKALPEEAQAALEEIKSEVLPAGEEFTQINEVVNLTVDVEDDATQLILNMDLVKDYEEEKKLAALVGVPVEEEVKWFALSAIGQKDGSINLIIEDEGLLNLLKANKSKLTVMIVE